MRLVKTLTTCAVTLVCVAPAARVEAQRAISTDTMAWGLPLHVYFDALANIGDPLTGHVPYFQWYFDDPRSASLGSEFVATSISSGGDGEAGEDDTGGDETIVIDDQALGDPYTV